MALGNIVMVLRLAEATPHDRAVDQDEQQYRVWEYTTELRRFLSKNGILCPCASSTGTRQLNPRKLALVNKSAYLESLNQPEQGLRTLFNVDWATTDVLRDTPQEEHLEEESIIPTVVCSQFFSLVLGSQFCVVCTVFAPVVTCFFHLIKAV